MTETETASKPSPRKDNEVMLSLTAALIIAPPVQSPMTGDALLDDLQKRAIHFFWNESHPSTGFTKDRANNFKADVQENAIASSAATGFALVAYALGSEKKILKKTEAKARTLLTLKSINTKWANDHGWLYHFVNWRTGEREWKCEASSIDTSILLAGVLASQSYWNDAAISKEGDKFVKRIDWKWMMTDGGAKPDETLFSMGWTPEKGFINSRWYGYSEEKMLYLQAYGADPKIDNAGWDRTGRVLNSYKGIDFISGGPLFMHQMSESFYDFSNMRDRRGFNYFVATKNATLANRQYCIDNPKNFAGYGPDFWALSACDTPEGYKALGAPGWIDDNGTITPTSGIASLRFTPKESLSLAEALRRDHADAYGRYGFSNGICPDKKWVGPDVIGIDLGMMMCGIENARTGLVFKWSNANPIIKRGYPRTGLHLVPNSNKGPLEVK